MWRPALLIALLLPGAAIAQDDTTPPPAAPSASAPAGGGAAPLRLPPRESFRLFRGAYDSPRIDLSDLSQGKRLFHQPGDPDSLFTLGRPAPTGELKIMAAVDVNEIFLKAIPPDPNVSATDTRPRAPGSFLPVDSGGRPYQLRLGARLVW